MMAMRVSIASVVRFEDVIDGSGAGILAARPWASLRYDAGRLVLVSRNSRGIVVRKAITAGARLQLPLTRQLAESVEDGLIRGNVVLNLILANI